MWRVEAGLCRGRATACIRSAAAACTRSSAAFGLPHHGRDVAALRRLHHLYSRHVLQRPVGPACDDLQAECGQYPVPAVPDYRCEVGLGPGDDVLVSCSNLGWLYYGLLKEDWTLITVNSIGASLQSLYIVAFIVYTAEKRYPLYQVLLSLGVLVLGYMYFYLWVQDVDSRLSQLGLFCSVFTISMYLSPIVDLAQIIRTKSTKCLSFPLTVTTLLTSTSWVLYGLQHRDPYIMVPNFPGIVTSILRLWLFWKYPQDQPFYRSLQA
ncbi:sugar transporter SWEET1 isoform X2 [Anomaloglossus baeobatrachus]|uniref:sugar transporter SWEET1 isoform X2 n=1 Tax=Anomaloglossus baeobatrachus TaxID=238106 RepID=UPI003F502D09